MRALVGIQAQDRAASLLALRARGASPAAAVDESSRSGAPTAAADVDESLRAGGPIVRTWAMRGTLHLIAAEDLALVLAVFGPLHLARGERRLTQLGLPPDVAERSTAEAAEIVGTEGPLTRHELAARLRDRGVPVDPKGQAPIHVLRRAALAGVLCEVGVRGREELYGPVDPGPLPDRDAAVAALARRYAAAHAPATMEDFAAWSGLPAGDVRSAWSEPEPPAGRAFEGPVRLLPAFDEWLLGWAAREGVVPPEHARRVAPGGGIIRPVAIADGRVFGTWRLDRRALRVELDAFGPVPPGVEAEVASIGAFLGLELSVVSQTRPTAAG